MQIVTGYHKWAARLALITFTVFTFAGCGDDDSDSGEPEYTCISPPNAHGDVVKKQYQYCYNPSEIYSAYGVDALAEDDLRGQGQTIVLVNFYGSQTARNDLEVFHNTYFPDLPMPELDIRFPLGQPNYDDSVAERMRVEASLDLQWSHAIAPEANLVMLVVPTIDITQFITVLEEEIQSGDLPKGSVFSMSLGVAEPLLSDQDIQTGEALFQAGNEAGYTFFASSGDTGTTNSMTLGENSPLNPFPYPTVIYPASSHYVTAVGGTQLQLGWQWVPLNDQPEVDGEINPSYRNFVSAPGERLEVVWNESYIPVATGGGVSQKLPQPDWQASVADRIGSDYRGVPDISWNAAVNGGVLVYVNGQWEIIGGTSASSPQVAALVALAFQQASGMGEVNYGNINSALYQLPDTAYNDTVPHIAGTALSAQFTHNQLFTSNADGTVSLGDIEGHSVLTGWDLTTGFGSPKGKVFIDAFTQAILESQ